MDLSSVLHLVCARRDRDIRRATAAPRRRTGERTVSGDADHPSYDHPLNAQIHVAPLTSPRAYSPPYANQFHFCALCGIECPLDAVIVRQLCSGLLHVPALQKLHLSGMLCVDEMTPSGHAFDVG
jgi:hypothetical protein